MMRCTMFSVSRRCARGVRWPVLAALLVCCGATASRASEPEVLPASDAVMKACADELARTMTLHMADLDRPYFVQFIVDDNISYRISAAYGALVSTNRNRQRVFSCDVRAGDYKLDNSNFAGGGGGFAGGRGRGGGRPAARGGATMLPTDDSPLAIREAIWGAVDDDYKHAAETLARKRAYMKDKHLTERPDDFTKATAVTDTEPPASMALDRAAWEQNVQQLSAQFKRFPQIQDSGVQLAARLSNSYILNSEGTRLRKGETGVVLSIHASGQADDGMHFSDGLSYSGLSPDDLPSLEKITADIEKLAADLSAAMKAPILQNYSGPVLFEGRAAARMFRSMLVGGVVGRAEPVGSQRRSMAGAEGLERQLGLPVLPKSFHVFDDPTVEKVGDTRLAGHYRYDDEGVAAKRVDIVVNGLLKDLCMSRTPTKKLSGSNGHGRQAGAGAPRPEIGCLHIEDSKALSDSELKQKLIDAAREAGLEYGIRIAATAAAGGGGRAEMIARFARRGRGGGGAGGGGGLGGGSRLGDPVLVYKVFVKDGREEPVRGCEFGEADAKTLKKIIAAGKTPYVFNAETGGLATTIIAPSVLFEELELTPIEQENDMRPLLKPPSARKGEAIGRGAAEVP